MKNCESCAHLKTPFGEQPCLGCFDFDRWKPKSITTRADYLRAANDAELSRAIADIAFYEAIRQIKELGYEPMVTQEILLKRALYKAVINFLRQPYTPEE